MLSSLISQSATVISLHGSSPRETTAKGKRSKASIAIPGFLKTVMLSCCMQF